MARERRTKGGRAGLLASSCIIRNNGLIEVDDQTVIHKVEGALFPNWSDTLQRRPFVLDGNELSLQGVDDDGRLTNEMVWMQKGLDY
jgi:hypothetical protein